VVSFEISQVERSIWQRRARAKLAAILRTHTDLLILILAWTVGLAGSILLGRVAVPAATPEARFFDTGKTALVLRESSSTPMSGTVHLRAESRRNRVSVLVTATVFTTGDAR
jgi:hypothetical protein